MVPKYLACGLHLYVYERSIVGATINLTWGTPLSWPSRYDTRVTRRQLSSHGHGPTETSIV